MSSSAAIEEVVVRPKHAGGRPKKNIKKLVKEIEIKLIQKPTVDLIV